MFRRYRLHVGRALALHQEVGKLDPQPQRVQLQSADDWCNRPEIYVNRLPLVRTRGQDVARSPAIGDPSCLCMGSFRKDEISILLDVSELGITELLASLGDR